MVLHEIRKLLHSRLTMLLMAMFLLANGLVTWGQPLPGTYSYTNVCSEHIRTLYAALPEDGEQALAEAEKRVIAHIRARGIRPAENGLSLNGAVAQVAGHLTREERADMARRAASGERISL